MTFRCPVTKKVSAPGEKPVNVVLETRKRQYWSTPDGKAPRPGEWIPRVNRYGDEERGPEVIGEGTEIVHEMMVSKAGAEILKQQLSDVALAEAPL